MLLSVHLGFGFEFVGWVGGVVVFPEIGSYSVTLTILELTM